MRKRILILGGASYDTIVHLDHFFTDVPQTVFAKRAFAMVGSTGVGKAFALRHLGFEVDFYALIGDDPEGTRIRHDCEALGIRCLFDVATDGTERHLNLMNDAGQRISIFLNTPSAFVSVMADSLREAVEKADVIVLNINDYCRRWIPLCQSSGKEIWVDLHDYDGRQTYHDDFIKAADVLFLSEDDRDLAQKRLSALSTEGKHFVVATHGSEGATLMTRERVHTLPAMNVASVVDTNGAGDSFFAGFLAWYLEGNTEEQCLYAGIWAGAMAVQSDLIANPAMTMATLRKGVTILEGEKG